MPPVIQARSGGEARIKSIYRGEEGRRLVSILAPEQLFREDVMQRLGEVGIDDAAASADRPKRARSGSSWCFASARTSSDLPVEAVDEVARVPDRVTRVPKAPKFLEGVVNLRGDVVPVVDQRRRFDMPAARAGRRAPACRCANRTPPRGLDRRQRFRSAAHAADAIKAAPDLTEDIARLVHGVVNIEAEGRMILMLDPAELLTRAERGLLDKFESSAQAPS